MNSATHSPTLTATLAALASLAVAACSGGEPAAAKEPRPFPVLVTTVRHTATPEHRVLTATVRARVETDLGFRTTGRVVQRLVDVGDVVASGQPLARLDAADHALGLQSAADQVRAATAEAEQANAEEGRLRRLVGDGSVSAADHERQKARADAATARLDHARRALDLARNRASYTTLVAPYAGVVTGLRFEVGQVISEGQPVAALARQGDPEVVADVPDTLIARIRELQATASPWHGAGDPVKLTLREVSPMASGASGTFRVRYALVSSGKSAEKLRLGETARLRLAAAGSDAVALPASALIKAGGVAGVWVVESLTGAITFTPVQVKAFEADAVRVTGLQGGSLVVSVGAQKLDASMRVTPIARRGDDTSPTDLMAARGNS